MGCQITVELEGEEILSVKGNTCPIGDTYARQEVTRPERTVTSTVIVRGGEKPRTGKDARIEDLTHQLPAPPRG